MTREEILAMEESELRIAVAEQIFHAKIIGKEGSNPPMYLLVGDKGAGWTPLSGVRWQNARWTYLEEDAWSDCPEYGSSIAAAWEVVNKHKIQIDEEKFLLNYLRQGNWAGEGWHCVIGDTHVYGCSTAPEAICKAALLAVMEGQANEKV